MMDSLALRDPSVRSSPVDRPTSATGQAGGGHTRDGHSIDSIKMVKEVPFDIRGPKTSSGSPARTRGSLENAGCGLAV
jgi:hypothetical protein